MSYWYVAEDKPLFDGVNKLAASYQAAHPDVKLDDMFQNEKVALYLANPFVLGDIQNRFPNLRIGVTPMPRDQEQAVQSGAYHIGIPTTGKNHALAWATCPRGCRPARPCRGSTVAVVHFHRGSGEGGRPSPAS